MWSVSRIARLASVAAGLALVAAPAFAQPPGRRGGDPRGLEAEVVRLKAQVQELEAKLKAAQGSGRKGGEKTGEVRKSSDRPAGRGFGPGGLGRPGPEQMRERRERFESMRGEREFGPPGRGFGSGGFGRPSPEQMRQMRERFDLMSAGREFKPAGRTGASATSAEVLKRLDRLSDEIDELRKLVRK